MTREALLQLMILGELLSASDIGPEFSVDVLLLADAKFTEIQWHRSDASRLIVKIGTQMAKMKDADLRDSVKRMALGVLRQRIRTKARVELTKPLVVDPRERQEMELKKALRAAEKLLRAHRAAIEDMNRETA